MGVKPSSQRAVNPLSDTYRPGSTWCITLELSVQAGMAGLRSVGGRTVIPFNVRQLEDQGPVREPSPHQPSHSSRSRKPGQRRLRWRSAARLGRTRSVGLAPPRHQQRDRSTSALCIQETPLLHAQLEWRSTSGFLRDLTGLFDPLSPRMHTACTAAKFLPRTTPFNCRCGKSIGRDEPNDLTPFAFTLE